MQEYVCTYACVHVSQVAWWSIYMSLAYLNGAQDAYAFDLVLAFELITSLTEIYVGTGTCCF